jgi:hypothetical protein
VQWWWTSALGHWLAGWIFMLGPSNLPTCGSISSLWRHAPGGLGSGIAVLESASWHVGVGLSDCRTAGNILYVPPGNFDDICMSPLGNVTPGNESSALPAAVFWVESVSLLCVHNLVSHCCCYVCSVSLCWSLCQVGLIYWLALRIGCWHHWWTVLFARYGLECVPCMPMPGFGGGRLHRKLRMSVCGTLACTQEACCGWVLHR